METREEDQDHRWTNTGNRTELNGTLLFSAWRRAGGIMGTYPSEGDDVERVLSAVDGVQEVAVGDLRTGKHLQLTADRSRKFTVVTNGVVLNKDGRHGGG